MAKGPSRLNSIRTTSALNALGIEILEIDTYASSSASDVVCTTLRLLDSSDPGTEKICDQPTVRDGIRPARKKCVSTLDTG